MWRACRWGRVNQTNWFIGNGSIAAMQRRVNDFLKRVSDVGLPLFVSGSLSVFFEMFYMVVTAEKIWLEPLLVMRHSFRLSSRPASESHPLPAQ